MQRIAPLALVVLVSLTAVAGAQPKAGKPGAPPAKADKVKVLDITDGEDITADRPSGELMPIGIRESAKSSSLIRIRHDFIDLILKAAETI